MTLCPTLQKRDIVPQSSKTWECAQLFKNVTMCPNFSKCDFMPNSTKMRHCAQLLSYHNHTLSKGVKEKTSIFESSSFIWYLEWYQNLLIMRILKMSLILTFNKEVTELFKVKDSTNFLCWQKLQNLKYVTVHIYDFQFCSVGCSSAWLVPAHVVRFSVAKATLQ